MLGFEVGCVVRSVAGHDKDRFYVIVKVAGDRVAIADGKLRKLAKPKAKNTAHLRHTNTTLDMEVVTTDKKLREALAPLNRGESTKPGSCPGRKEGGN